MNIEVEHSFVASLNCHIYIFKHAIYNSACFFQCFFKWLEIFNYFCYQKQNYARNYIIKLTKKLATGIAIMNSFI